MSRKGKNSIIVVLKGKAMAALHLTEKDFEKKIAKGVALVDFWALWCGPCRMVGPVIDDLAQEYQGKVLVGKVNVDEEPQLAEKFGIMSIPTVVVFKDGKEAERVTGFVGKESYKEMVEKQLK